MDNFPKEVEFYADNKMSATMLKVLFLSFCLLVLQMVMRNSTKFFTDNLSLIPTSFIWTTNIKVTTRSSSFSLKRSVGREHVGSQAKVYDLDKTIYSAFQRPFEGVLMQDY